MDRKSGANLYFAVLLVILHITVTNALDQECTNSTLIEPLATNCVTTSFVAFSAAADDAAKCVIATGTILPCITTAVQDTYTVTCTDAQQYIVIIGFRSTITAALQGFDVVEKCLPTFTCGDITSIVYYAARACSEQLLEFQTHTNCSTLCGLATCYAIAASEVSSCSVDDFEQTITDNAAAWQAAFAETQTEMCCPSVGLIFNLELTVYALAVITGVFLQKHFLT
ncbi:uncharacterized protein LOC143051018 isoform X1 [Mytilus galloprovincialis]|uniref:uncharacterized protein LOC143051018 isoform X1 n=1 Tax=Mytilus galloprovincialis TaxID=29158 RepID=UPI003F7C8D92